MPVLAEKVMRGIDQPAQDEIRPGGIARRRSRLIHDELGRIGDQLRIHRDTGGQTDGLRTARGDRTAIGRSRIGEERQARSRR